MRLFSTEQVSKYHPDKYADQVSDAILDACLKGDKDSRVACETLIKGNTIVLAGEITTKAKVGFADIAGSVSKKLGYKMPYVASYITMQSPQIAMGVKSGDELCAGDQGMMYGYACRETESMLPFGFDLANKIIAAIEDDVAAEPNQLVGDAKCQVTVDLDAPKNMSSVKKVLVSACHSRDFKLDYVKARVKDILFQLGVYEGRAEIIVNPAGEWTIGGAEADCGLTGRKIVCDQYGGYCPVGGGAFSGKDPSRVDRSGAYMARQIACDILTEFGDVDNVEVQIAYAIGQREPMSVNVRTEGRDAFDEMATAWVMKEYDLTPSGIIKRLGLLDPSRVNYEKLAEGCHFRNGMWR